MSELNFQSASLRYTVHKQAPIAISTQLLDLQPKVRVTPPATTKLSQQLESLEDNVVLRVQVDASGLVLDLDYREKDDILISLGPIELVMSPRSYARLSSLLIDVDPDQGYNILYSTSEDVVTDSCNVSGNCCGPDCC